MKRLFFLLWMTGIGCLMMAKNPVGKIKFEKTSFHFGTFEKRIVRTCVFVFKNTGSAPVVINQANTTCNCTSVRFDQTPILPNKKGYITVIYDGKYYNKGYFRKSIDVWSNAENGMVRLFISGTTK